MNRLLRLAVIGACSLASGILAYKAAASYPLVVFAPLLAFFAGLLYKGDGQ